MMTIVAKPVKTSAFLLCALIIIETVISSTCFAAQYKCTRVTDGDTITVTQNGFKTTIRLVGIDAPEKSRGKHKPGQPFSQKSTKYLAGLVLNKYVEIVSYGTDRYGRTLGVVYVNGKNVNLEMVKAGLAEVYRGKPAPGFDNGPYWDAEKKAQDAATGMWSLGDRYMSPREWRRMNK
jgi:endonuclease YncB( thermonuclease family)